MMKPRRWLALTLIVCLGLVWLGQAGAAAQERKELDLLLTNDLHGQLEPMPAGRSGAAEGGLARLAAAVAEIRNGRAGQSLLLSAGDDLTGRFFRFFHGRATYAVMDRIGYDAGTLGNHEFDLGPQVLAEALGYRKFPAIESNLRPVPGGPLKDQFADYLVLERGGLKIGLLGLMTPDLALISRVEDSVSLEDLNGQAGRAVRLLREREGVDLVVAVTHIGLDLDRRLAAGVGGLDVICGGHSHTLLPAGQEVVVDRPDGGRTVIVQAGSRGQYLGRLSLSLTDGRIATHQWRPRRLTEESPQDRQVAEMIAAFKGQLPAALVLAQCKVPLDLRRETVRTREAAAGNLIADILRTSLKTDLALVNGGNIRGDRIAPAGPVTTELIQEMLPFGNEAIILNLSGQTIREALEWGAGRLPQAEGVFLQVSGLRYSLRTGRPAGERVVEIQVPGPEGGWKPLDRSRIYSVATSSFLAGGGDGFAMLKGAQSRATYLSLSALVENALKQGQEIAPRLEGRIRFLQ